MKNKDREKAYMLPDCQVEHRAIEEGDFPLLNCHLYSNVFIFFFCWTVLVLFFVVVFCWTVTYLQIYLYCFLLFFLLNCICIVFCFFAELSPISKYILLLLLNCHLFANIVVIFLLNCLLFENIFVLFAELSPPWMSPQNMDLQHTLGAALNHFQFQTQFWTDMSIEYRNWFPISMDCREAKIQIWKWKNRGKIWEPPTAYYLSQEGVEE